MKPLLPDILSESRDGDRAEIQLRVQPELTYFDGHFPGFPILPGVVQIDWAVRFARRHFHWNGAFSAMENVKFLAIVLPEAKLTLELAFSGQRLTFNYSTPERKYSSGRIVFDKEI